MSHGFCDIPKVKQEKTMSLSTQDILVLAPCLVFLELSFLIQELGATFSRSYYYYNQARPHIPMFSVGSCERQMFHHFLAMLRTLSYV